MKHCLILGCGYSGSRVARRLLAKGFNVTATTRSLRHQADLQAAGCRVEMLDSNDKVALSRISGFVDTKSVVLLSIPSLTTVRNNIANHEDPIARIVEALGGTPSRVVYLSTTGVYGDTKHVDEVTSIAPITERQLCRVDAENAVARQPWSSLILRPAAIYGPKRGIHCAIKEKSLRLAENGANFISRIHVEDLASLIVAALESDITGAYPVADENPCTSREIARYCADLFELPMPYSRKEPSIDGTRHVNRKVDGRAICKLLGVKLRYPSYREGISAAIAEEVANKKSATN